MRPIRLLTFTTLFPNAEQPNHGVFVENRLRHLLASGAATSTVVAPVPWFPSASLRFGEWSRYARVPACETRGGVRVLHPRFPAIPRVGMSLAPALLHRAMRPVLRRLLAEGPRPDLIDAHYFYPDGVAAIRLGREFGLPVAVTSRGTDVNLIPRHRGPRRMLQRAVLQADGLIAVSEAIAAALRELGAPEGRTRVLRNGVDAAMFRETARGATRAALGLAGPCLISVGHLIERKGHHRVIEAARLLPDCSVLIVGEGPERPRLEALIARHALGERVRLLGARPHAELPSLYSAADVLVLASTREGWANVLLEAMACGTPVVASDAWGNKEAVLSAEAGVIVSENAPAPIADGVRRVLAAGIPRALTRAYAEAFSWDATTAGQIELFETILSRAGTAVRSVA
jgi:glycosyltransferase involved in cell wall biosynthesis